MNDIFRGLSNYTRVERSFRDSRTGRLFRQWAYVPRAQVINEVQEPLEELQRTTPAEGRPIPLAYGKVQLGGSVFAASYKNEQWTIGYILCYGEISSFINVTLNGQPPVAGVSIEYYKGTTGQGVSPFLANAISGYYDDLRINHPTEGWQGVAYIVIRYSDSDYDNIPQLLVTLNSRLVWNPKTQTKVFSENPALHLGDFMRDKVVGMGLTVDDVALENAQDYNDTVVGSQVRRKSFFVVKDRKDAPSIVEAMRLYASCFVLNDNNVYKLLPDKDDTPEMDITPLDFEEDSVAVTQTDVVSVPTVVSAYYTDVSQDVWRTRLCDPVKAEGVDAGLVPTRESKLRLDGITRHSQAVRECTERLNKLTLGNIVIKWKQYASAQQLQKGSIVTFTSAMGFDKKPLRITNCVETSPGIWDVTGTEHDPSFYSDTVVSEPTFDDVSVPMGVYPSAPGFVGAFEEVYILKNGEYASRLLINWTAPPRSFVTDYYIEVLEGADLVWTGISATLDIPTGPLQENKTYEVRVYSRNSLYTSVAYATTNATVDGDTDVAADVGVLNGAVKDGVVFLNWPAVIGARRYEVRYYATGQTWSAGTILEKVDGLNLTTDRVPNGTWKFGVRALTSVGVYSLSTAELTMVVSSDTGGRTTYYQNDEPTGATLNDDWYDLDDNNHHYYWDGSSWVSLRDGTISEAAALAQQALDDASVALTTAQAADLRVDGKVTTYLTAVEPTIALFPDLSEGDLWLKAAPVSASVYNTWRTGLGINYAIMLDDVVDDNGTAQDAPAYSGLYGDFALPNRPSGRGIIEDWIGWELTALDIDGGPHSVGFSVYIPSNLADGQYALYSNGGSGSGQLIYIKATSGVFKLVVTHVGGGSPETITNNTNLNSGHNIITVSLIADVANDRCVIYVDGVLALDVALTVRLVDGTSSPRIGSAGSVIPDGADNPLAIDGSGIVIADFLEDSGDFITDLGQGINLSQEFYTQLTQPSASGEVLQYRYNGSSWVTFKDSGISDAEAAAIAAQESADKKIISWYGVNDPSISPGGFDASNDGDLWFDSGNDNRVKRWDHSQGAWIDVRDAGIQLAIDDASAALSTAQAADLRVDGKVTTYLTAVEPTIALFPDLSEGDLWLKAAPVSASVYNTWRTGLGINYSIMLDDVVDDNGTAQDAPAYSGLYGDFALPNRPSGRGIIEDWIGWDLTVLDGNGGPHSIGFSVYIPSNLADGQYALYSNGGSGSGQLIYIKATSGNFKLVVTHVGGGSPETITNNINLSAGANIITVSLIADVANDRCVIYVDGVEAANINLTVRLVDGSTIPRIGSAGSVIPDGADNPLAIDGSGIVIADFLEDSGDFSSGNLSQEFYTQLTQPSASGEVIQYRYNGSSWVVFRDSSISDAEAAAIAAQDTADKKIITWYGVNDPSVDPGGFDASNDGDLWFDSGNDNQVKRWSHFQGIWENVRDAGIQLAIDDAAAALGIAQTADLKVDGKVTTYLTATEPTIALFPGLSEGDIWLKSAPASPADYNTWRTSIGAEYAIMFNDTVDDNGTAQDAPAYTLTYSDFILPNRPNGRGIDDRYSGSWTGTALDNVGGAHSLALTLYIPSNLANGAYGLYTNGGSTNGQCFYVRANGGVFSLVVIHCSSGNYEVITNNTPLAAGANVIAVNYLSTPDKCKIYVDGALVVDASLAYPLADGTSDPGIGLKSAISGDGADVPENITGSGLVIGDFFEGSDFTVDLGSGTNVSEELYNQLTQPSASGNVEQYRYNGNSWTKFIDSGISDAEAAAIAAQDTADKKIISWYGTVDPSINPGGFDASNDGDIWFDANNQNQMKRWSHFQGLWENVRDEGIQQGIDDASAALAAAQAAQETADSLATADGNIVSFFQVTMPTDAESSEGDLWFKGAAISAASYNAWRTSQSIEYAIMLNGSVDDNGTAQDAPAYTGAYSSAGQPTFPNRANGKGITDSWITGWPNTVLDNAGGTHSLAFGIYIPSDLANGSYGLYANGGSSACQVIYIYKSGATLQLVAGHTSANDTTEMDKARLTLTPGSHTIGVAYVDDLPDRLRVSIDGAEVFNSALTNALSNGASGPEIGTCGPSGVAANVPDQPALEITGSGIAISDFLEQQNADWSPGGNNLFQDFHNQLFSGSGGGDVEQYRYDGTPGGWVRVRDVDISDAQATALAAQATADSKIITWYGTVDPSTVNSFDLNNDGDLWVDEGNGNELKRWVHASSAWVSVRDSGIGDAINTANNANDTANNAEDLANQALLGTESSPRTANFTCVKFKRYPIDTSGGSFIANLPNPPALGDVVGFFDYAKTWHDNSFFINPGAGNKIEGTTANEDLECNLLGAAFLLQYTGATKGWMIV